MRIRISALLAILTLLSLLIGCGGGGSSGGSGSVSSVTEGSSTPPLAGTASVTLYWDEVTEDTSNNSLIVSGYKVYYDTSSKDAGEIYAYSADLGRASLSDPANPATIISSLSPGTWYFRVSAYYAGNEGQKSEEISITVL